MIATPEDALRIIGEYFGVADYITRRYRGKKYVDARNAACWIMRYIYGINTIEIGRRLKIHYSSVSVAQQKTTRNIYYWRDTYEQMVEVCGKMNVPEATLKKALNKARNVRKI